MNIKSSNILSGSCNLPNFFNNSVSGYGLSGGSGIGALSGSTMIHNEIRTFTPSDPFWIGILDDEILSNWTKERDDGFILDYTNITKFTSIPTDNKDIFDITFEYQYYDFIATGGYICTETLPMTVYDEDYLRLMLQMENL